ncbi:uncharacterized protein LOC119082532 [Bradysia coprophila]|uniref:uncharacterized protein LOC119082532 n=1 Tax=Bradysia coprophila TaxID=38358 RepID=UPI00187D880A|nr:uncharacterized protein LOC119082532 [Bradysia coprophila]
MQSSQQYQANIQQSNAPQANAHHASQSNQFNRDINSNTIATSRTALLATAIVNVETTDGKVIIARALIDEGSNGSLIKLQLARQLGILQAPQNIPIKGVGGMIVQESTSVVRFIVSSRVDTKFKVEVEAFTIKNVSADLPSTQIQRKDWPHLNGLKLADEFYDKSSSIDILLGIEVYEEIILDGIIRKIDNSPTAMNSRLGWLMFGKVKVEDVVPQINSLHTVIHNENLNDILKSFWEMEEVPQQRKYTVKEQQAEIMKESSLTTKLRVVFNASKKSTNGISLNDKLLVGPKTQDDLYDILIRWRTHYVTFIADIEKMFRQIKLAPHQRDYQRILWRFSPNEPILEYRITTVIDGTASASFLATRTLNQLATDEEPNYPLAAQVTRRDFYMDDVSSGSHDVQSAIKLQNELIAMLKGGGFLLRKWYSNKREILENVPIENRHDAEAIVELVDTSIKTLGVYWNQKTDCFQFKVTLSKLKPTVTKREVLSDIAKLFDPIGWLSPSTVIAKIFMQSLWTIKGLDWDNNLPKDKYDEWMLFRSNLASLEQVKLERWLGTSKTCKVELYGFSDASIKAYAAVVYSRVEYEDGTVKVSIISGKTKVAPIKVISTPKLELCGCVLLANLVNKVKKSLSFEDVDTYLYSDSTICLAWITSHPNHWNVFVANRITEIQQLSQVKSWGFVDTNNNPADCATRGVEPQNLNDHELWWKGPGWMMNDKTNRPNQQTGHYETDEERKNAIHTMHVRVQNTDLHMSNVLKSFSSLSSLLKTTAFVLRWLPSYKDKPKSNTPKANEYRAALKSWIKCTQAECFETEIELCLFGDELPRKSKLLPLRPFLDSDGILRVGGRLSNSDLPFESKHPIILPKRHHLTKLLIEQAHDLTLHGGPSLMSAFLNKFWIFGRSQQIRKVVSSCIKCYPFNCKPQQQVMADLPRNRVTPNRVFSHSGVDFAGPVTVKNFIGRSRGKYANIETKSYIAIFVCLATKAIHIEFVSDMTSVKFIEAFKRFVARRGQVTDLYSDNGTNFVGADNILREHMAELNKDPTIQNYFARQGTTWHFNPPASPHHGGLWEAGERLQPLFPNLA